MRKKLILLALSLAFLTATFALASSGRKRKDDLFRQVGLFSDTLAIIEENYVEEVSPKDLIYGALRGILSTLDPHSQFLDVDTYNELKVQTQGKFGGIGIEVTIQDGILTVITPIEDTPAWKAGLKPLDKIVKINNDITKNMTLSEAVKKMRGKPGEKVTLTILRESEKKLLEIKLTRDIIKIKDISQAKILEDSIGYIRLAEFKENTFRNLNAALNELSKQRMNSLIIDLRNNPGGLLESSVDVCAKFLPKGKLIVYTKGRKADQDLKFFANQNRPITNLPLIILINEGSASGSEIMAAALKHYKRAIIMGSKSFGKGSVQTLIPLSDGSAIKLTTSKYYTPGDKQIHGQGVIPDIVVQKKEKTDNKKDNPDSADVIFKELELDTESINIAEKEFNYKNDEQIMRAVDLLKALRFYKEKQ